MLFQASSPSIALLASIPPSLNPKRLEVTRCTGGIQLLAVAKTSATSKFLKMRLFFCGGIIIYENFAGK